MARTVLLLLSLVFFFPQAAFAVEDTLTLGTTLEPPHLDPTATAAEATKEVTYFNIFQGLTRIDRHGRVQPALAERWSISPDGLVYTFDLRRRVRFHDGASFDSAAVVYSYRRAMAPGSENGHKELFEPIADIVAPDPHRVVITLKRPSSSFLFNMGLGDAVIVHPDSAAGNKSKPIGTGPFRLKQWVRGDRVELERNPDYWGPPPALRMATIRFITNPARVVSELADGTLQAFPYFSGRDVMEKFRNRPDFTVMLGTTEGETLLAINNARKPFDDLRVRRALAHAVNRRAFYDDPIIAAGSPIGSHFSPSHPAYVDLTERYSYDPAAARALLAEAGLATGLKATLLLPPPAYSRFAGLVVADQLAEIGVKIEIERIEWKDWLERVFKQRDFDLTIISHTEPFDIGIYARDNYYFGYANERFKELWQHIESTLDEERRTSLLREAQRMLADDSVNVFLFMLGKIGVWNARLEGLWENYPIAVNDLSEVRWRR